MLETSRRNPKDTKNVRVVDDASQKIKIALFVRDVNGNIQQKVMKENSFVSLKRKYCLSDIEVGAIINNEPKTIFFGNGNFWVMSKSSLENAKAYCIDERQLLVKRG